MTDLQKERFTMAPVALIEYVRDKRITPTAYALWHVLWSYSDSEKRECWPSRATLAQSLGLKRAGSVDPYIEQLVAVGAVVKFGRSDGKEQLSNGYRLVFDVSPGHSLYGLGDWGSPENRTGVAPKTVHEQEPLNNNQLTRTTISPNRTDSECVSEKESKLNINDNGDEPVLLPEDWNYNDTHVTLMDEKLPDHHHDLIAAVFALEFDGHHSSDWHKKFSWWINHVATNEYAMDAFNATIDTFAGIDPPTGLEAA